VSYRRSMENEIRLTPMKGVNNRYQDSGGIGLAG
jgi:hypothetical protein